MHILHSYINSFFTIFYKLLIYRFLDAILMTDFMKRTDPQDLTKQSHIDTKETIIMNTIDMHNAMVNNME